MKYLLAYDGSANSKQALDFTIKLLKPTDDQLVVLTVTERIPQADWPFFGDGALRVPSFHTVGPLGAGPALTDCRLA